MGYSMSIENTELEVREGKTKEEVEDILERIGCLPPMKYAEREDGSMWLELEEYYFNWHEEIYSDLAVLARICDGHMEMIGEQNEHIWYELENGVVKEIEGRVVYEEEPSLVLDTNNPVLKKLFSDGVYSDERIILMRKGSEYIMVDRKEVRFLVFWDTHSITAFLHGYAMMGENALENCKWGTGYGSIKEWANILTAGGFPAEAVALQLAYQ